MATYSAAQVSVMARSVGWPNPDLVGQIAMAESSGSSTVVNSIGAVGLLQVNQPVHVHDHPSWTVAYLQDPINNLRAGLTLYNADKAAGGSGYRPWVSSQDVWGKTAAATAISDPGGSDKYKGCEGIAGPVGDWCKQMDQGQTPDPGGATGGGSADGLLRLAQDAAKAGNWLADPRNWVRVAYVAGGAILIITAIAVIAKPYAASVQSALPTEGAKTAVRRTKATHAAVKKYGGQILEGFK